MNDRDEKEAGEKIRTERERERVAGRLVREMLGLFNEYKRFLRTACLYDNTFGKLDSIANPSNVSFSSSSSLEYIFLRVIYLLRRLSV